MKVFSYKMQHKNYEWSFALLTPSNEYHLSKTILIIISYILRQYVVYVKDIVALKQL